LSPFFFVFFFVLFSADLPVQRTHKKQKMSDGIHRHLAEYARSLLAFETQGILPRPQLRAVLARLRTHEAAVRQRPTPVQAFFKYIEYLTALEKLREKRHARLGLRHRPATDRAIVQFTHAVFRRALRKFPSDVDMWTQYIDWAEGQAKAAGKTLSRIFAR
jgi:U3 small nucleolar RNA-associated protein 6